MKPTLLILASGLIAAAGLIHHGQPKVARSGSKPKASEQFYTAIRENDIAGLRDLIHESGLEVRDAEGNSPLMIAAADGSLECFRMLLRAGSNPNAANASGATPLMWAAGDADKVRSLLGSGAKVNVKSKIGCSALEMACNYDGNGETVRLLVQAGANVNSKNRALVTALEAAAGSNNLVAAKLLIAHGADVNNRDRGGFTPLINACFSCNHNGEMVKLLVRHGAKVKTKSGDNAGFVLNGPIALGKITALHLAVTTSYEATKTIIDAGADVNALDVRKVTPLVFAVANDHPNIKIVKLLLAHGAKKGPAVTWAKRYNDTAVLAAFGLAPKGFGGPTNFPDYMFGQSVPESRVIASMTKALKVCQKAGDSFGKAGGCVSCHAQIATGLAVWSAKPVGAKADYKKELASAFKLKKETESVTSNTFLLQDPGGGADSFAHVLTHLSAAGTKPSLATDSMVHYLAAMQHKEGDWPEVGTIRPPLEDGSFTCTAYAIRALRAYSIPGRKEEIDERIARAARWLENAKPVTNEDRTMQILGLVWAGKKVPEKMIAALETKQYRNSGGWSQTDNLPADAYATGTALLALHEAGVPRSDMAFQGGMEFLITTQKRDGTWHVATRSLAFQPYFQSGFPYGHDQWISQMGTATAASALALALQQSPSR